MTEAAIFSLKDPVHHRIKKKLLRAHNGCEFALATLQWAFNDDIFLTEVDHIL